MSGRARWKAYLSASRSMQDGIIIRESTSSRLVSIIAAVQERPQHEPGPVYGELRPPPGPRCHGRPQSRGGTMGRAPVLRRRAPVPSMPLPGAAHKKGPRAKPGPVGT